MGADCFHIWCEFPFLNKKSGTVLDLNYCCSAVAFGISEHVFSSGVGLLQRAQQRLPVLQSSPCQPQGKDLQKGELSTKGSSHLPCASLFTVWPWGIMAGNKMSNGTCCPGWDLWKSHPQKSEMAHHLSAETLPTSRCLGFGFLLIILSIP